MTAKLNWINYIVRAILVQSLAWSVIVLLRRLFLGIPDLFIWEGLFALIAGDANFSAGPPEPYFNSCLCTIIFIIPLLFVFLFLGRGETAKENGGPISTFQQLYLKGMFIAFSIPMVTNLFGAFRALLRMIFGIYPVPIQTQLYSLPISNFEAFTYSLIGLVVLALFGGYYFFMIRRSGEEVKVVSGRPQMS